MAEPARVMPITTAMEPVTSGGRIRSILSRPKRSMRKPARMETRPERMMPNWAWLMRASGATWPNSLAPVIETTAAM